MVGSQLCGSIPNRTKQGATYTVNCTKPVRGGFIQLITVQNTYLHVMSVRAYGYGRGRTVSYRRRGRGGRGGRLGDGWLRRQNISMSSTYSKNFNAFKCVQGGTSITQRGVGQYW